MGNYIGKYVDYYESTYNWQYVFRAANHFVYNGRYIVDLLHCWLEKKPVKMGNLAKALLEAKPISITSSSTANGSIITLTAKITTQPTCLKFKLLYSVNNSTPQIITEEFVLTYAHILVAMDIFMLEAIKANADINN